MSRPEIISRLEDPELPEKIVAELNHSEHSQAAQPVLAGPPEKPTAKPGEFDSQVHGWNRHVLWRRSSKE